MQMSTFSEDGILKSFPIWLYFPYLDMKTTRKITIYIGIICSTILKSELSFF